MGIGRISSSDSDDDPQAAFAFAAHFGGMLSPRLALLVELSLSAFTVEEPQFTTQITQGNFLVGAQYWVAPKIWLRGGIGRATLTTRYEDGSEDDPLKGTAVIVAAGYEIYHRQRWVLEGQVRVGFAGYTVDDTDQQTTATALQLGVAWY